MAGSPGCWWPLLCPFSVSSPFHSWPVFKTRPPPHRSPLPAMGLLCSSQGPRCLPAPRAGLSHGCGHHCTVLAVCPWAVTVVPIVQDRPCGCMMLAAWWPSHPSVPCPSKVSRQLLALSLRPCGHRARVSGSACGLRVAIPGPWRQGHQEASGHGEELTAGGGLEGGLLVPSLAFLLCCNKGSVRQSGRRQVACGGKLCL